jgi:hypothetical protein
MRLVITGSRRGHPDVRRWLTAWHERHGAPQMCIVGDANGVDAEAFSVARELGWEVWMLRVDPSLPSPRRYHDRNERMVGLACSGDVCLAFPDEESRGTYHCAWLAKRAGLTVHFARTTG